jgi:HrpA-like RNA helicase
MRDEQFFLTALGRFYIDIPIDITYCKLLVASLLFDTFEDVLILVAILSQSKNAVRKGNIDRKYAAFY